MGKRKERRLAAMMAANRRVKLDLFAEPTGEMVEASLNDEAGGGFDQNDHPVDCKSPSSSDCRAAEVLHTFNVQTWCGCHGDILSDCQTFLAAIKHFGDPGCFLIGKPPENPLLLLGQYSDDELDEPEVDKVQVAATENPDAEKVLEASREGDDVIENNSAKSSTPHDNAEDVACKFNLLQAVDNVENNDISKVATVLDSLGEANGTVMISDVEPPEPQNLGVNEVVWKAVMHEQSGRYYYWNVETGETSWERPNSLTSEMLPVGDDGGTSAVTDGGGVLSAPKEFLALNGEPTAPPDNLSDGSEFATPLNDLSSTLHEARPEDVPEVNIASDDGKNNGAKDSFMDMEGTQKSSVDIMSSTKVAVEDALTDSRHDDSLDNGGSAKTKIIQDEECKGKLVESDQLIECCNSLLRRLNELHRLDGTIEGRNRRSKYSLEVEVRLSDCKALAPFGFSLLPLWLHIEACLERLALIINEEEAALLASKHVKAVDSQCSSPGRRNVDAQENFTPESESKLREQDLDASVMDGSGMKKPNTDADEISEQPSVSSDDTGHDSSSISPNKVAVDGLLEEGEIESSFIDDHVVSSPNPEIGRTGGQGFSEAYSGKTADLDNLHDDVDMDVDMEVDEDSENRNAVTQTNPSTNYSLPAEHQIFASPQLSVERLPPIPDPVGEPCPPPPEEPPEEDWIPPPPPDNDPTPPPPPDDPPVPQYASSSLYAHQDMFPPLPYTQHYSFTYTVPVLDYYGATTAEVPDSNYYSHGVGVGSQLEAQVQGYEEMVNPIAEGSSVIANPVGPIVYYEAPRVESSASVATVLQSSGYHDISGSICYSDTLGGSHVGSTLDSLPNHEVERDASPFDSNTQEAPKHIAASSAMLSIKEGSAVTTATATAATAAAAAAAAAATKNPSKVGRVKKKTVAVASTLRSNKKVSSLVDKWKAAKEELHAEEKDEPENAYEILERKRQREIEEWHAKQVASGEAQDNANFQPLGGDWRERVKRKRAEKKGIETETESDQATIEKQQPNVTKLSENLPSGWQAYWDESSGQVYYGNSLTMETSWTRPVS